MLQKITPMQEEFLFEVFLDLQKVHDALEQERCLNILAVYGVGPRAL